MVPYTMMHDKEAYDAGLGDNLAHMAETAAHLRQEFHLVPKAARKNKKYIVYDFRELYPNIHLSSKVIFAAAGDEQLLRKTSILLGTSKSNMKISLGEEFGTWKVVYEVARIDVKPRYAGAIKEAAKVDNMDIIQRLRNGMSISN